MDQSTINFYDHIAEQFFHEWFHNKKLLSVLKELIIGLPERPIVLDPGCGTGGESKRMKEPGASVTGIDLSLKSIELTRKNVAGCYYGHFYMVNAQSPAAVQEAAWKFVSFMLSHPEEYLEKVGIVQPTKKLLASETYANMEYSDVFAENMAWAHIVYYTENSTRMQELIREAVESVMLSGVDPEKALASLKVKAQELLDQ